MRRADTAWDWIRRTAGLVLTVYLAVTEPGNVSAWLAVLIAGLLFGPDVVTAQNLINIKAERTDRGDER